MVRRLNAGAGRAFAGLLRRLSFFDALSLARPRSPSRGFKNFLAALRAASLDHKLLAPDPLTPSLRGRACGSKRRREQHRLPLDRASGAGGMCARSVATKGEDVLR